MQVNFKIVIDIDFVEHCLRCFNPRCSADAVISMTDDSYSITVVMATDHNCHLKQITFLIFKCFSAEKTWFEVFSCLKYC